MDMLQTVIRASIDRFSMTLPPELQHVALAAAGADLGDHGQHDVLAGHFRSGACRRRC